jgi:hypothetical protein
VTNGLDVAVGIHKGIISMSNPRYMAWVFTPQHLGYWLKISGSGGDRHVP